MRDLTSKFLAMAICVGLLLACGGGGGGKGSPAPDGAWLTFTPNPVTATGPQGLSRTLTFTATSAKTISETLYAVLADPGGITTGNPSIRFDAAKLQYTVTFTTSATLPAGTYSGNFELRLYTDSQNTQSYPGSPWNIPYQVTVTPRYSAHKLLPEVTGVALSQVPGWSRLTRTLAVADNLGQSTAWQALSDRAWLTVTASGTTPAALTLTADPAALPVDQVSYATVTLTSSDPTVKPVEKIRVGFWKGSATPMESSLAATYSKAVADPVGPFVYLNAGGSRIDVYNAYTAAKVATIQTQASNLGGMAISPDGLSLYGLDLGNRQGILVDLATRAQTQSWPLVNAVTTYNSMLCLRPNGVGILLVNDGTAYLASPAAGLSTATGIQGAMTATNDGHTVFTLVFGGSPAGLARYALDYSDQGGGYLISQRVATVFSVGNSGNGRDVAVSGDGRNLFTASGAPYAILSVDPGSLALRSYLTGGYAYPSNVEVASDGRVFAGTGSSNGGDAVLVYTGSGSLLYSRRVPGLLEGQLVVTGDGIVCVALSTSNLIFTPVAP